MALTMSPWPATPFAHQNFVEQLGRQLFGTGFGLGCGRGGGCLGRRWPALGKHGVRPQKQGKGEGQVQRAEVKLHRPIIIQANTPLSLSAHA